MTRAGVRSWKRWLVIGAVAVAAALVAGPFIYIHFIQGKAPPPLALSSTTPAATVTAGATGTSSGTGAAGSGAVTSDGTWNVAGGSVVGYRVKEVLFGQSNEAVGRTGAITGSITVSGTTVTGGSFSVDMTSVTSDESRRDGQFNGRIMETSVYPTATLRITEPIDFGSVPADGVQRTYTATGELTLHGVTKSVQFQVTGRISGSTVEVAGSIPITFSDWNIGNPSFGPVTTEDHGVLEFALNLTHA
jgi:polyisoprenoid-binding protein YceI